MQTALIDSSFFDSCATVPKQTEEAWWSLHVSTSPMSLRAAQMIGFALTLLLQSAGAESLAVEGEALGRVITVMAVCASVGYGDNPEMARGLNSDLERRALSAGYGHAVVMDAFRAGMAGEKRAFAADEGRSETSPEARLQRAVNIVTRIKQRCREVANEHPGLITDLERGEAAADGRLDALIRTLD